MDIEFPDISEMDIEFPDTSQDFFSDIDFNLDIDDLDVNKDGVVAKSALKSKSLTLNNIKKQFAKIKKIEEITDFPKKNEEIEIITQSQFSSSTFIAYAIQKFKKIDELIIVSFSISKEIMRFLFQLKSDEFIEKMDMYLSDHLARWRVETVKEMINLAKENNVNVRLTYSHAKIILMRIGEDYYCVTGSGKLSQNARMEQYNFRNIKKVYNFYKEVFHDIFFKDERKMESYLDKKVKNG